MAKRGNPTGKGGFTKGRSGNPTGRPKKDPEVDEILRAKSPAAARKLVELMDCDDPRVALQAATKIVEHAIGTPKQKVEVTGKDGDALKFQQEVIDRPPRETYEQWLERRERELVEKSH